MIVYIIKYISKYVRKYISKLSKPSINSTVIFILSFTSLSFLFYEFNIAFIGVTTPGGIYIEYLDQQFNYIAVWRAFCLKSAAIVLTALDHNVTYSSTTLHIENKAGFQLVYSCLGYGIMSIFMAFVVCYRLPNYRITISSRLKFLLIGLLTIQMANTARLVAITLYWRRSPLIFQMNHHGIYNIALYTLIILMIICWVQTIESNIKKSIK